MGTLDGRVAIVTGGGRGIGRSISRLFAQEGAQLVINDLGGHPDGTGSDEGPARDVAEEITAAGGSAISDGGDIADTDTGERLVRAAIDTYGKLDVVVNVAGILRDRMIFNLPPEDWDAVIRVHLRGHYSTIRGRRLLAVDPQPRRPLPDHQLLLRLRPARLARATELRGREAGHRGPDVLAGPGPSAVRGTANAIAPGASTRLTDTIPDDKRTGTGIGDSASPDPQMSPDNIAPICAYLASTESDWLTGRTLSASGYKVGLYNNPEIIAEVDSDGPWQLDDLAAKLAGTFRPVADGVPYVAFAAAQVASAGS